MTETCHECGDPVAFKPGVVSRTTMNWYGDSVETTTVVICPDCSDVEGRR